MANNINIPSPSSKLSTGLVLFSVLATGIGQSMTFSLLAPPLAREVDLSEIQIGLIITCSALAFTLTSHSGGAGYVIVGGAGNRCY